MKNCTKCNLQKEGSEFNICKRNKDGLQYRCRSCNSSESAKWHKENPVLARENRKKFVAKNPDYDREWKKRHRENNPEKVRLARQDSYQRHKDSENASNRVWHKKNPDYTKEKRKSNVNYRLGLLIRHRLYLALKSGNYRKTGSAVKNLGCTIPELKVHLESRFQPGMTWGNQGEWHIDHIWPISKFDLQDPGQLAMACHYTNLQPLWAFENISKGDKIL
jgi:hypothetical protein